ncbi:10353_t:CDS:2 [Paraglomus occultum]|uniref:10353_t:CDS:1 n=1 Tax=Paraglomus occultum TaxID=144539 RepID=A0A9N9FRP7_9GLOM|nr:10353_t:CDS:2 [Paraglomus occultum]
MDHSLFLLFGDDVIQFNFNLKEVQPSKLVTVQLCILFCCGFDCTVKNGISAPNSLMQGWPGKEGSGPSTTAG